MPKLTSQTKVEVEAGIQKLDNARGIDSLDDELEIERVNKVLKISSEGILGSEVKLVTTKSEIHEVIKGWEKENITLPVRPSNPEMPKDYSFIVEPEAVKLHLPNLASDEKVIKICSYNVASLRAASKKGLLEYVLAEDPTILCLQETKLQTKPTEDEPFFSSTQFAHQSWWCSTSKKGYSGTAILSKIQPIEEIYGFSKGCGVIDDEGRLISLEFDDFFLVTAYVPNAGDKLIRLNFRLEWEQALAKHLEILEKSGKPVMYTGDLNVAHHPIDLAKPKENICNAGFSIEERKAFTSLLYFQSKDAPRIDLDRRFHPKERARYTFYGYRGGSRAKGTGWRLDYFIANPTLKDRCLAVNTRFECYGASDHLPIVLWMKAKHNHAKIKADPKIGPKVITESKQASITSFFKPKTQK